MDSAGDPEQPKSRRPIGVSVVVDQGTITIDDTAAGRSWQIDDLACEITVPRDPAKNWSWPPAAVSRGRASRTVCLAVEPVAWPGGE